MELLLRIADRQYRVDTAHGMPVSIPLRFNDAQPNTYGVQRALSRPYQTHDFTGDVREGGSCNFESYTLVPHCNGTHTECIGHITGSRISVHDTIQESLIPATVISVPLHTPEETPESYTPLLQQGDLLVTGAALETALSESDPSFHDALLIRTLPNDPGKMHRDYMQKPAPFFTHAAMHLLHHLGVRHLLVDFPSLDRLFDDGLLSNHRLFWNLPPYTIEPTHDSRMKASVTEMIYIPDSIPDGQYLLNLQFPSFVADAAPSKPVVFPIDPIEESAYG